MELHELFNSANVKLQLESGEKDDVLMELIGLLQLDDKAKEMLFKMLKKRENLGSTGIGKGFAIPHCRSLVVDKLNVAFGRHLKGLDFNSIDGKPAHYFFLIVAPPVEISNYYLPVLGKVAQFCKTPDITSKLDKMDSVDDFLKLLDKSGS
jgi:mannitol/fructose-specific phosphotransferase system IIA component (Ntr-type)